MSLSALVQPINDFLTQCLYNIGWKRSSVEEEPVNDDEKVTASKAAPVRGTQGEIKADALMMKEDDKLVLVVDQELEDVPSWVEWDIATDKLLIVQTGGATAELNKLIPSEKREILEEVQRFMLVTNSGGERVAHYLPFLIRN